MHLLSTVSLRDAFVAGKAAWPRIALSYEQFVTHIERLGHASAALLAHPADIFLCTACLNGERVAYQALEARYFPGLRAPIYDVVRERLAVDDILQELRVRLFIGVSPKIATYRGTGSLKGWLRRVAIHASHDYRRERALQDRRIREVIDAQGSGAARPEDSSARNPPVVLCEQAWRGAFTSLASAELSLLHQYFVSGFSIDVLADIHAVHRATAARRIQRAIECLRQAVKKSFSAQYRDLNREELYNLIRLSCSLIDLNDALSSAACLPPRKAIVA